MQVTVRKLKEDSSAKHCIDTKTTRRKVPKAVANCVLLTVLSSGMTQAILFRFSTSFGGMRTMDVRGIVVLVNKAQKLSNFMLLFVWFSEFVIVAINANKFCTRRSVRRPTSRTLSYG